jgi:HAD superfamily hydrolase (TIGR01509 family)
MPENIIQAILWDNDGVLVDTETLFFETTRSAFARLGIVLTKEIWGRRYLGDGERSREIALSLGGDPDRISEMIDGRNRQYRKLLEQPPLVRPQVQETLAALFGRVTMAMVTGCHRDQLHLIHGTNGLMGFFDTVVTGDDCSLSKPHPEPYLAALKALNVNAECCIAVEDSPKGLASARAAGIACVVVPTQLTRFLGFPGALSIEQDVSGVLKYFTVSRNGCRKTI